MIFGVSAWWSLCLYMIPFYNNVRDMKIIRVILGKIILFLDQVFSPQLMIERTPVQQQSLDEKTKNWALYQLETCPFCVKVRRHMKRLGIHIPFKNIAHDEAAYRELIEGGKLDQYPCLRYTDDAGAVHWMYESSDINEFLTKIST